MSQHTIVAVTLIIAVAFTQSGNVGADEPQAKESPLMTAWRNLEKGEPEATRAALQLSRDPVATIAWFREHLKPLKLDGERFKELMVKLSSIHEPTWQAAFEELEYFDPRLALDLPTMMDVVQLSPVRQRLVSVMVGIPYHAEPHPFIGKEIEFEVYDNGRRYRFIVANGGAWSAEHRIGQLNQNAQYLNKPKWTRALRAIAILESIGTPEAIAILEDLANGHPEAQPTITAKESLDRLQQP